ncbi:MAG: hypothetical protein WC091_19220 [Sulfuricellaceae bacterium]
MTTPPADPSHIEALEQKMREMQAELDAARQAAATGSGAVAQGGGDALGRHSVKVENANSGTINTGTQIVNHYYAACNQRLTKEEIARRVSGYLEWLVARTQSIELRGIERAGGAAVVILPLETAYVPLRAKPLQHLDSAQARAGFERMKDGADFEREADIALNQVPALGNRLAITGGPGSGKTTVLLHMAWALATSLLANNPEPARSRLGLTLAPKRATVADLRAARLLRPPPPRTARQRAAAGNDADPLHHPPPDLLPRRVRFAR